MALSEVFPEPSSDLADQPNIASKTRPSNILDKLSFPCETN